MADLLDSGNPATSNWWDSMYQGDANSLGSYYSATNPGTGKAESIVNAFSGSSPQGTPLPWSEYQKQLGAGTVDRFTTTSKNPDKSSNFMGDWGFTLPLGGFFGSGVLAGAGGTDGAAAGLDTLGAGGSSGGLDLLLNPAQASFAGGEANIFNPAVSSAMTPGAWGWGAGAAGSAGIAANGFDFGGPTGADDLLGTGGPEASGGTQGFDMQGTGIDQLMGTGGPEVSGGSGPLQMLQYMGNNALSSLRSIFSNQGGNNAGGGGAFGNALSIGSGLYGLYNSEQQKRLAKQIMSRSDPFASSRGMYGDRLNALMGDPSSITSVPGYAAGLQAVERRMASQGFNGSGNMITALSKYGGDFYNQEVQRLETLSGANAAPGAGSSVGGQVFSGGVDTASRALASLGYGGRGATGGIPLPPAVLAYLKSIGV